MITGLLQTAAAARIPVPKLEFRREELTLPSMRKPPGRHTCPEVVPVGIVSLDWLEPTAASSKVNGVPPIVIIVPGLTSSSAEGYVR